MTDAACPFCGSDIKLSSGLDGIYQHASNVRECIIGDLAINDIAAWNRRATPKAEWRTMESAPRDRMIVLWGEVDAGDRGAGAGPVQALWCSDQGLFGEDGGWMVAFTDNCIASVESPAAWRPLPPPPKAEGGK